MNSILELKVVDTRECVVLLIRRSISTCGNLYCEALIIWRTFEIFSTIYALRTVVEERSRREASYLDYALFYTADCYAIFVAFMVDITDILQILIINAHRSPMKELNTSLRQYLYTFEDSFSVLLSLSSKLLLLERSLVRFEEFSQAD